jgi:uncharacterized membrane protein
MPAADLAAAATSATALLLYHAFIAFNARRDPNYTVQQVNAQIRRLWVEGVLHKNKDLLAVQTLRNSTMAATFFASTSVILVLGIVNVLAKGDSLAPPANVALSLTLFDLFLAFFGFTTSIRLYNHAGYMLGVSGIVERDEHAVSRVARHLDRAAQHYSAGMRAFYLTIPLVFWFFGPKALLAATLGLLVVFYVNDRAPKTS